MPASDDTMLHRALADPRRARLLAVLGGAGEALDASELGRRVGLHANTVRWHLAILAQAGLVTSRTRGSGEPGRPRRVYQLDPAATAAMAGSAVADGHRGLAAALVDLASDWSDAPAAAERAGRTWGAEIVGDGGAERAGEPLGRLVALLDEHGFDAVSEGLEVTMHRCPFLDLARQSPEVVCGVHRGLLDGALAALGAGLEVEALDVLPRPGICVAHLAPRPSSAPR